MNLEEEFKIFRQKLEINDLSLTKAEFTDKIPQFLEILGNESPYLRDELGWNTLASYFRSELCPSILRSQCLKLLYSEDFLFFKIAEVETSASLKRSFGSLTIADLLLGDSKNELVFNKNQISDLAEILCLYIKMEKDFRGPDKKLGWIHSIAHIGDCFNALFSHPNCSEENILKCSVAILTFIEERGVLIFCWNEELRLGRAIAKGIVKLSYANLDQVIFSHFTSDKIFDMPAVQNILNTFRCAYLEILWKYDGKDKNEYLVRIEKLIR